MKQNYEDLQKYIDALNNKAGKVSDQIDALKEEFNNEDYEKDKEFERVLEDKLDECDRDINGEDTGKPINAKPLTANADELDGGKAEKEKPLQMRKKNIIAAINKMVNLFNENNKQIKESNKIPKSEKELKDLIKKNKGIQDDCVLIEEKIGEAKVFADEIDVRLDKLIDPAMPQLKEKYAAKNGLIDKCDEQFDKADAQINDLEAKVNKELDAVEDIIKKLSNVSPISVPTGSQADPATKKFVGEVAKKLKEANDLRDELEK